MPSFEIVREKVDQAVDILNKKEIDLWLTFARETTQARDPCLDLVLGLDLTWQSALMITRRGERIAIVGRFDVDNVQRVGAYTTVESYDSSIRQPMLEHLTRLDPQKIAVNFSESDPAADGLTHGMFRVLNAILSRTEYAKRLVSSEDVIWALRGRKSPIEVTHTKAAIRATEAIFRRIDRLVHADLTEREIARWFHGAAWQEGLDLAWRAGSCPALTAGPDSSFGHAMPGDCTIQPGCLLQADFGVRKSGFVSDLQRTWYLLDGGETSPPADVSAGWDSARRALEAGRAALQPGARGWEVDRAARQALVQAGYPEYMHAFGHHIGRTAHDGATILGPRWDRYGTSIDGVVEVGNIFAIELGVPVPGRGYIGCEEDVLVTPQGAEYLSNPQTELWCV